MFFPFGEYRPDVSDLRAPTTLALANVLPRADGYGPFPDLSILTAALPAACRGLFFARKSDGSVVIFAGTATRLYKLGNADYTWTDVSAGGAAYSALVAADQWQFAQFNDLVLAAQANVAPQVFDMASASAFAALAGSPPQARYVAVIGRFVVLSGLLSNPFRLQWSGLNAVTTWTSGVNSSDVQDLPDGGLVRTVVGGENAGLVFQDGGIRRMTYVPGSPLIFQIDKPVSDLGILAPLSAVKAGNRTLFLASKGFHSIEQTGYPVPIGRERIDRSFLADYDAASPQLMLGAADPRSSRVFWAYRGAGSVAAAGLFDRIIGYDLALDRWIPPIGVSGEYLCAFAQPGVTLENLDAVSSSLDALTQSLDSFSSTAQPELACVDAAHRAGFFRGSNLEAALQTAEHAADDEGRIYVRALRPLSDAPIVYGSVIARETRAGAAVPGAETALNAIGVCPQRISTRYARGKLRIPAGTVWTFASGLEAEVVADGKR